MGRGRLCLRRLSTRNQEGAGIGQPRSGQRGVAKAPKHHQSCRFWRHFSVFARGSFPFRVRMIRTRMPGAKEHDVTGLLVEWRNGNQDALNRLMPLVYAELHALAARQLRRERTEHTLQSTALVHEAYLRLIDQRRVEWQHRDHFFAVASQMIRRILVNYARSRTAAKRGGAQTTLVLDERIAASGSREIDV